MIINILYIKNEYFMSNISKIDIIASPQAMNEALCDNFFGFLAVFCFLFGSLGNIVSLVYFLQSRGNLFRVTQILYTYIATIGM